MLRGFPNSYLVNASNCSEAASPGGFPNCRRTICLLCSLLMMASLTGSQSMLGISSWLGRRQHSSIKGSSGSLGWFSSRPAQRQRGNAGLLRPGKQLCPWIPCRLSLEPRTYSTTPLAKRASGRRCCKPGRALFPRTVRERTMLVGIVTGATNQEIPGSNPTCAMSLLFCTLS